MAAHDWFIFFSKFKKVKKKILRNPFWGFRDNDALRCSVGDGNTTIFWHDYWTDLDPLILAIGNRGPHDLRINLEVQVSSAVVNSEWFLPPARSDEAMT